MSTTTTTPPTTTTTASTTAPSTGVAIVAAVARNGVIGAGGKLPWRLPDDLRRFRRLTMGGTVIMGRRTYDSIGRPLDGRRNIVITRNAAFAAPGAERAASLEDALTRARKGWEHAKKDRGGIFIIGGGEIYAAALKSEVAEEMFLTEVDLAVDGDAHFPSFPPAAWREEARENGKPEDGGIPHSFVRFRRVGAVGAKNSDSE